MSGPKVLISGSGIAGSVFAFWLLRAYPRVSITTIEKAPSPRLTGASVDIRNAAVDIIKWMGLEEEIRWSGTNEAGVSFLRKDGSLIGTIGATGRTDVQSLTSEYEIFRGALAKIFMDPVQDRVQLVFDETVESYSQNENGVTVTFSKSKQIEKYDLLVAADGMGSKIRGMMLGKPSREQVYDEGVRVCFFTIKKPLVTDKLAKWYNATRGRVIFLRPDTKQGVTRGAFMNVRWRSNLAAKERFDQAMAGGNEAYMQLMEEEFRDAGWLAKEVLEGMRESDDFYCSIFGQTRCPKFQDGRVVLIGDSAHAVPGFGTSLAIMSAYTLAGELLEHGGDVPAATKAYEDLMLPYVKSQQGNDVAMQLMNPETSWGLSIRNAIVMMVTTLKLDLLVMSISAKLGLADSKLKLPKYPWPAEAEK